MIGTRVGLAAAVVAALAWPALGASPVLVTVTGAVENANRGPMNPDEDKLFVFTGSEFEAAHGFTLEALQGLPQTTVRSDFPKGGPVAEFTGPSFEALLEAAGHEVLMVDAHLGGLTLDGVVEAVAAFAPAMTVVTTAPTYLFWRCAQPELRVPREFLVALDGRGRIDADSLVTQVGPAGTATPDRRLVARSASDGRLHVRLTPASGAPLALTFVREN